MLTFNLVNSGFGLVVLLGCVAVASLPLSEEDVPLSQIPAQCFSSSVSVPHVDDVTILDTTARLEKVEFRSGSRVRFETCTAYWYE